MWWARSSTRCSRKARTCCGLATPSMAAPRCSTWHPRRAASSSWSPPNRGTTRSSRTRSPTPRSARTACWPSAEPEPASEAVHLTALTSTPSDRCRRSDVTCNLLARSKRLRRWWHDHRPADPASSVPPLTVRPITPDDAPRLGDLLQRCSPETTYNRFFTAIRRPRPATLQWLAEVDHFRREALVAMCDGAVVAVARYDWTGAADDQAEIAILVEDAWQRRRVGTTLLPLLADLAIDRGVRVFTATVLANNTAVAQLLRRVFPSVIVRNEGYAHAVTIPLGTPQGLAFAPMPRSGGVPTLAKAVT